MPTVSQPQPDCLAATEAYWRACAAIRAGDVAAGIADLLPLARVPAPALRRRVRELLAAHGAGIAEEPGARPAH